MSLTVQANDIASLMESSPFLYKALLEAKSGKDNKNNGTCAVCTALVGMIQQYTAIHSLNIDDFIMNDFCTLFPGEVKPACQAIVQEFGPTIIHALTQTKSADKVCQISNVCKYPQCILFTNETSPEVTLSSDWSMYLQEYFYQPEKAPVSPIDDLIKLLEEILRTQKPMSDLDGDLYSSSMAEGRGYHWRGRDCNDIDIKMHPGRKSDPYAGAALDYNCNGISGKDPQTHKDYKDVLCANSGQLGVALIGDSAGIFAQIPNEFVTAADWNKTTFANIWPTVMDQGGHPQFSAYTGYEDIGYHGNVSSVYKYLYQRNKCNFRDYQNLAVSGAASGATLNNAKYLSRNQTLDHPLLVIMELAANDVCFGHTTSPDDFRKNILEILDWFDTVLPAGSHLLSIGLVNGSVIHEMTHNRTHPMGMSYDAFYDYLNCLGIDLCEGYLTSNLTTIADTTAKAMALNQVYVEIFSNYTAKNFDFIHYDFPAQEIIDQWTSMGGDPYELISHVDGFHPSQNFNQLMGDFLWNSLVRDRPQWLGDVNPNNDLIESLFGDQGGY